MCRDRVSQAALTTRPALQPQHAHSHSLYSSGSVVTLCMSHFSEHDTRVICPCERKQSNIIHNREIYEIFHIREHNIFNWEEERSRHIPDELSRTHTHTCHLFASRLCLFEDSSNGFLVLFENPHLHA